MKGAQRTQPNLQNIIQKLAPHNWKIWVISLKSVSTKNLNYEKFNHQDKFNISLFWVEISKTCSGQVFSHNKYCFRLIFILFIFFHFNIVCQSAKVHLLLLKLIIWTWKHFYSCGACNHATHFSNNLIQNVFSHKNIVFFLIYIIELFTGWFSYLFWSSNILFFTILLQNSKQN